jgi:hypothetical protein
MAASNDRRFPASDRWHRETASPEWGVRVIDEIRSHLDRAGAMVRVESMHTDGGVLTVLYRHSAVGGHGGVYGLRRRLDYPPTVGDPAGDLAAWLGARIAEFELIEPAGGLATPPDSAGICWRNVPRDPV